MYIALGSLGSLALRFFSAEFFDIQISNMGIHEAKKSIQMNILMNSAEIDRDIHIALLTSTLYPGSEALSAAFLKTFDL